MHKRRAKGTAPGAFFHAPVFLAGQRAMGKPVGCIHPSCPASKIQINSTMDTATRSASAQAMRLDLVTGEGLARSMKNRALPSAANMARKASATRYFIRGIIG